MNGCLWSNNLTLNISVEALEWNHLVFMPYVVIASICLIDAAGFLTLFYLKTPAQNYYETLNEQSETCITLPAKITVVICFFFINTSLNTYIFGVEYYLYDVAIYSDLKFQKTEAVNLLNVYHVMNLMSVLSVFIILKFVSVKQVFHLSLFMAQVSSVLLAVYGLHSKLLLWILPATTIYFVSPVTFIGKCINMVQQAKTRLLLPYDIFHKYRFSNFIGNLIGANFSLKVLSLTLVNLHP